MWWKPPYICARCDDYVPHDEPVVYIKEPSRRVGTRNYFKVPVCMGCVRNDADVWGYYESIVDGRRLELIDCCSCGRCLLVYVPPNKRRDEIACSKACADKLSKRTVSALRAWREA